MLYDNEGRELDARGLLNEFFDLEPVDSLAQRYHLTEEQVFGLVGGGAIVGTLNSKFVFDFDSEPATVTRYPYLSGSELQGDESPLPLLSITQWRPFLEMYVLLPGNTYPTARVTSNVLAVAFQ